MMKCKEVLAGESMLEANDTLIQYSNGLHKLIKGR